MDAALPKGIFAYGRLPLMLTRNCPVKNGMSCSVCGRRQFLIDRRDVKFPVRCRGAFSELLNSVPIYLADRISDLQGLDFLLLSFTDESAQEVKDVINAYRFGAPPAADYTRGLYYRNVK